MEKIQSIIPNDQLLTVFLEDIKNDKKYVYNQVLSFLDITNSHEPSFTKENTASIVRFNWLQKIILNPPHAVKLIAKPFKKIGLPLGKIARTLNKKSSTNVNISQEFKDKIFACFADDITKIEKLTGRNTSHWKQRKTEDSGVSTAA